MIDCKRQIVHAPGVATTRGRTDICGKTGAMDGKGSKSRDGNILNCFGFEHALLGLFPKFTALRRFSCYDERQGA